MMDVDREGEEAFFLVLSSTDLWKEFRKYMYPHKKVANFYNYRNGSSAIYHNYYGLIKEKLTTLDYDDMGIAAKFASLEIIKFLYYYKRILLIKHVPYIIDIAACNNRLEIVKFLICKGESHSNSIIVEVLKYGHIEVAKFLFLNGKYNKETQYLIFKYAVFLQRLDLLEFFYENSRLEKIYPSNLTDFAAENGYLEILKFLYKNKMGEKCTSTGMDRAIFYGHFETIKFICENTHIKCTYSAMNQAVLSGNIKIVEYLFAIWEDIDILSITKLVNNSATLGHLNIVKFFCNVLYPRELDVSRAIKQAETFNRQEVVEFLRLYINIFKASSF